MRTTIRVDGDLYRRAKAAASRDGRSVGELIGDAVRVALRLDRRAVEDVPALPTFGGSGLLPEADLDDRRCLVDAMDHEVGIDVLRWR